METVAVPESFPPILKWLTKVIMKMELQKLALHPVSNPLLQTLLLVLHTKDQSLCMKLCKAVLLQIDMFSSKRGKIKGPMESKECDVDEGEKEQGRWVCSQNVKNFFENAFLQHYHSLSCGGQVGMGLHVATLTP